MSREIRRADRFSVRDLLLEAFSGISSRPSKLLTMTLGTVLGIASLVVTIGFAQTAAGQIATQFDAVSATQVLVQPATAQVGDQSVSEAALPWDSPQRVDGLAGVRAAALIADVGHPSVTSVPVNDPSAPPPISPAVVATTPDFLEAVEGRVVTGRYFDAGHDRRADRVMVLGSRAAKVLGIDRVDNQPSVFVGGIPYSVIGIIDDVQRRADVLDSVIIPITTARNDFGLASPGELRLRISVGAGSVVAHQVPIALAPNSPSAFTVSAPPPASALRNNVQADVNVVFLILGAIALIIGGLGIANVTLLSVTERTGEIGLRRALGATRRDIAMQFMIESVIIGLFGGLVGSALGVLAVIVVSAARGWTPVLDTGLALSAALIGAIVGAGAGALPARRASVIEPVDALRSV